MTRRELKIATRVSRAKKAACARGTKHIRVSDKRGNKKSYTLASKVGSKCRWHDDSKTHGAPRKHNCPSGKKYSYAKGRCHTPGPVGAPRVCPDGQRNLCVVRRCGVPRASPGRPRRCPSGQKYSYVKRRCQAVGYKSPGSRQAARAAASIQKAFRRSKQRSNSDRKSGRKSNRKTAGKARPRLIEA